MTIDLPHDFSGSTLAGRYFLDERIGVGGHATVYRATAKHLGSKAVAVKLLNPELTAHEESLARFRAEVKLLGQVADPNRHLVDVWDAGESRGLFFYVMEYLRGHTLREVLTRLDGQPLPWRRAVHIATQVCDALVVAHRKLVHRDLKPENIFLVEDNGDTDFVKLLDLGIAKLLPEHSPALNREPTPELVGSALYVSPEQVEGGSLDGRADLYALGVVLYEMLTGQPPFTAKTTYLVLRQHLGALPKPPSSRVGAGTFPAELDAAVIRALNKNPDARFASAAEMGATLRDISRTTAVAKDSSMIPLDLEPKLPLSAEPAAAPRQRPTYRELDHLTRSLPRDDGEAAEFTVTATAGPPALEPARIGRTRSYLPVVGLCVLSLGATMYSAALLARSMHAPGELPASGLTIRELPQAPPTAAAAATPPRSGPHPARQPAAPERSTEDARSQVPASLSVLAPQSPPPAPPEPAPAPRSPPPALLVASPSPAPAPSQPPVTAPSTEPEPPPPRLRPERSTRSQVPKPADVDPPPLMDSPKPPPSSVPAAHPRIKSTLQLRRWPEGEADWKLLCATATSRLNTACANKVTDGKLELYATHVVRDGVVIDTTYPRPASTSLAICIQGVFNDMKGRRVVWTKPTPYQTKYVIYGGTP
jgi:serine/threonine protein kinase